jgi:AAA domain-containing protein
MGNCPEPTSSNENINVPQQTDPDIPLQAPKESALQKSNMEDTRPTQSNKPSYRESREKGRQHMNKKMAKHAEVSLKIGKKKREVEAEVKQLFETMKQAMHQSPEELFGTELSEVETHQIEWLWQGRIPLGKITILDGDPGMGKSLIAMNIVACVTTGQPMPDGTPGIQGGAIIIAPEDSAADTIKPRLEAAGVDPLQVLLLNTMETWM